MSQKEAKMTPLAHVVFTALAAIIASVFLIYFLNPLVKNIRRRFKENKSKKKEKIEKEKRERLAQLNQGWMLERAVLRAAEIPLIEFNSMDRYVHNALKCIELAKDIEKWAQYIQRPEFIAIRDKLLTYAAKKDLINEMTPQDELVRLFLKQVKPDKSEPFILIEEIRELLDSTNTPPYSEEDL